MKFISLIPTPYKILILLSFYAIATVGGIYVGIRWEKYNTQKDEITEQTARADDAEKDRDIANAPPATLPDVIEWLP